MTNIHTIRFYDRDLLKAARIQAVTEGITFRQLVEQAIRDYLANALAWRDVGRAQSDHASELQPEPRPAGRP